MADIFDGLSKLYAEHIESGRHVGQITRIEEGVEFFDHNSNSTNIGINVHVSGIDKPLGIPLEGDQAVTVRRQLGAATGERDTKKMVGKWIELYTERSGRSVGGKAIRITPNAATPPAPATADQVAEIERLVEVKGAEMEKIIKHIGKSYGAAALSDLTGDQAKAVIEPLSKRPDKGAE